MRKLALIVNPSAAGGRTIAALDEVCAALAAHGLRYRVEFTRTLEHAGELALAAATADETAVAFGGDGLVAAVAGALKHSDAVIGLLPGGRGNDLARTLGIPLEPRAACAVLASGVVRSLDLGEVDGRTFIGIASCGFDSDANRIANATRVVRGNLVYLYAAVAALAHWKPASFELTLDGEHRAFTGYSVALANSRSYGGGMLLAPDASMQDGHLEVVMIHQMPRARFLWLLPTVFRGAHVRFREVEITRAHEVELRCDRDFSLYADGDPIAELPARVRALPGAVRMIVPA
ncbi:MAG: diacylglycerol kinase family lipid kinase [Actinomycetota bacterium]|nr:diacylglycerol kinase family lipid kinase [Actinomycetota bacterium]